ncbi:DNA helicase [Trifolium repens]|nr:DNA helicase [Trifolium repens]
MNLPYALWEFDFIKDLTKDREIWKIAVRVVDSWDVIGINGQPHLEMVIVDAKGDRVQAVTRYKEYEHWKSFIQDHNIYVLHNCHVYDNDASFKICEGHFKVVFGSCTKFTKSNDITNLPLHEFHFKSFKEVLEGKFKINILYEIIGVLHEVVKTQTL